MQKEMEQKATAIDRKHLLIENLREVIDSLQQDEDSGVEEGIYDEKPEGREDIKLLEELLQMLEKPTSVLVIVEGGACTGIWSNDPTCGYDILDFDGMDITRDEHDPLIQEEAADRIYPIY